MCLLLSAVILLEQILSITLSLSLCLDFWRLAGGPQGLGSPARAPRPFQTQREAVSRPQARTQSLLSPIFLFLLPSLPPSLPTSFTSSTAVDIVLPVREAAGPDVHVKNSIFPWGRLHYLLSVEVMCAQRSTPAPLSHPSPRSPLSFFLSGQAFRRRAEVADHVTLRHQQWI